MMAVTHPSSHGSTIDVSRRQPAILATAMAADQMAEHLSPSWKRTGTIDVVSRDSVEAALRALDTMFAVEAQRFAFFHESPEDFEDGTYIGCDLTDEDSHAIVEMFSAPDISVISSFLNMDDEALAESLEFGLTSIEWDDEFRGMRELRLDPAGGNLPTAYLTHAFQRAKSRLQALLEQRIGLTRNQAKSATKQICQSVLIETVRAGAIASERLETLSSWVLTLLKIDMPFVTSLIARGSYLFLLALLAAASKNAESTIRDSVWSDQNHALEQACHSIGLGRENADFIRSAIIESKKYGRITTARQLATFCTMMAHWMTKKAEEHDASVEVIEASMSNCDWVDWHPAKMTMANYRPSADIIQFPAR